MAKNPEQLNQAQVDVLKWVADGCPDGVYTNGWQHRIVARALHNRGLVSVAGNGATWRATLTKAGRAWLDAPPTDILPGTAEVDRLVAQVIEAGGEFTVSAAQGPELKHLLQLIRMSVHSPNRPKGKKLEIRSAGYRSGPERTLEFIDNLDELVEIRPVPVPERVAKYHPAVRPYLDGRGGQHVSKEQVARAGRILQAVATEAEAREIQVVEASKAKANRDRPAYKAAKGDIWLATKHGEYSVTIKEVAGGDRLDLALDGRFAPYSGQHFRDAKSKTVEERLPEVFAALDKYQIQSDRWEEEQRRVEAERQRRRDEALVQAKVEHIRKAKWDHFIALVKSESTTARQRAFLDAAVEAIAELPNDQRVDAQRYLDEMRQRVDETDPLKTPGLILPRIGEPTAEQLAPLLKWNPFHHG
jgi:hypothetical protein